MLIENGFTVAASPEVVWAYVLDVEKVVPCMPGAELTETVDERTWKGRVLMAFGPVKMTFAGTVTLDELDDEARRVRLHAKGTEQRGKGAATAKVTSWLEPTDGGGTKVAMEADITLTGAAAQLSRGLLPEISKKLTQQFADCLRTAIATGPQTVSEAEAEVVEGVTPASHAAPPATAPDTAKPVGGLRLGLSALWSAVVRSFKRLFGSKDG